MSKLKNILDIAIKAFNEGSDCFGETPTRTVMSWTFSKLLESHQLSIVLANGKGTAGIGFYKSGDKLRVISGHEVFMVDITPEIQEELDEAIICEI